MADHPPSTGSSETGRRGRQAWLIVLSIVGVLLLGGGLYAFLGGAPSKPKKKISVVNVMPVLPPPPPPKQPTPPPPPPDTAPPPPDAPKFVEEAAPESPPEQEAAPDDPAPMGSNIQGDGSDGFGLSGRGGGGMIGGRGKGGAGSSRFGWYAGRVQNAVATAMRNNKVTRSARLDMKARIWLDSTGRVTKATLEGSSGDPKVDRALEMEILSGLQFSDPPPEGMPMPIVMRINASRP
jgi:TonB family protein